MKFVKGGESLLVSHYMYCTGNTAKIRPTPKTQLKDLESKYIFLLGLKYYYNVMLQ